MSPAPPWIRWPIGRRLAVGFLAVMLLAGSGVAVAVWATLDISQASRAVARLAEDGRRLARVGALVREFYMHQAHLALGMDHHEHFGLSQTARQALGEAVLQLGEPPPGAPWTLGPRALAPRLTRLDALFEQGFVPAHRAGQHAAAHRAHAESAAQIQALVDEIDRQELAVGAAIEAARIAVEAQGQRAAWRATTALAGAFLLALAVAWRTTRAVQGPVARLQQATEDLAGEQARVPTEGPPEVAALGAAINQMLDHLELQRRRRAEAETLAALGRVASGVAHEVNNPLGVILGHARLIERAGGPAAEDAGIIAREARDCQAIVRSLLDYARPGLPRRAPVDLGDLARGIAERFEGAVTCAVAEGALTAPGDRGRLQQLVGNLVHNGLAFGQRVWITVAPRAGTDGRPGVALTVEDDGPGVAPEALAQVFEPFYTTRPEGTGLGLAIARSVAVAHGGTLQAGASPCGGAAFQLWLPEEESDGPHPGD